MHHPSELTVHQRCQGVGSVEAREHREPLVPSERFRLKGGGEHDGRCSMGPVRLVPFIDFDIDITARSGQKVAQRRAEALVPMSPRVGPFTCDEDDFGIDRGDRSRYTRSENLTRTLVDAPRFGGAPVGECLQAT